LSVQPPFFADEHQKAIEKMVREHHLSIAQLTEQQVAQVVGQMLASGDITLFVQSDHQGQAVIYMPYAREQELKFEIDRLKGLLEKNGIPVDEPV
jgi:hypothetical protein